MITTDAEGLVESVSPLAERLTGWSCAEARGERIETVFRLAREPGGAAERTSQPAESEGGEPAGGVEESTLISRQGERFAIEHVIAPVRNEDGRITSILIVFHDVSRHKLAALALARQTTHDPLTGLLNRQALAATVEQELEAGVPFAICQVDLDQFNLVYNSCGHAAGDDLLQWVAALLREEARPHDVLARLGGDVFGVLFRETTGEEAGTLAEGVLQRLHSFQFTWDDKTFPLGASIGLVIVQRPGPTCEEALSAADHACSQAKRNGRNQVWIFQLEDEELGRQRQEMEWVARIRKHLSEGGVTLFGQPIMPLDGDGGDALSFEVLLRMTDPGGQLRSAARVIQAAEQYGLMASIDRWVIRTTLQTLRDLPRQVLSRVRLCAINISAVSLRDRSILEFIHEQLAHARIAPHLICFELTETAAVSNLAQARWLIDELLAIGCRFALDDFGSGLASYSHLKDLPVSFLKIAGSFVENVVTNPLDRAMVESIVQIARVLGVKVIAEAVASREALDAVRNLGVDFAQGHFLGPPRPLAELFRQRSPRR